MTTLEEVEKLYEAVLEDADKGDYAASMFLKHCDPYEWLSVEERAKAVAKAENDVDSDFYGQEGAGLNINELPQTGAKALYEAFKTNGDMKAALREMTGVVSNENQRMTAFLARFKLDEDFTLKTEELGLSFVPMKELKGAYTHLSIRNGELGLWNDTKFADIRYYEDEKELAKVLKGLIKPIVPKVKADDAFRTDPDKNAFIFLGGPALGKSKLYDDDMNDVGALKEALDHDIDYAQMHREEMALLKVKRRGRKKTRAKNRRLRENRDKASRERKRELRKQMAKKNEKKKQSKRERKRFSPISKEIRMLDESIKDGFSLK